MRRLSASLVVTWLLLVLVLVIAVPGSSVSVGMEAPATSTFPVMAIVPTVVFHV